MREYGRCSKIGESLNEKQRERGGRKGEGNATTDETQKACTPNPGASQEKKKGHGKRKHA